MMRTTLLKVHPGLAGGSRLPSLAKHDEYVDAAEILVLLGAGVCAAVATAMLDFSLRIPGHAILRAVFPMSFGLALAPRRMGGSVMGVGALSSALAIHGGGLAAIGVGSLTSLALIGPFLDLALARARQGWRLYLGFALAGLGTNLAALAARTAAKLVGWEHLGRQPLATWLPQALVTYALCGALAGAISAIVWFQFSDRPRAARKEPTL